MKPLFTSFWVILFITSSLCAYTQDKVVAYVEHNPPFILVEDNHISGAAVDILNKAMGGNDITFEFQQITWARAYLEAQQKPNIILTGLNRTPARDPNFHWLFKLPITYNSQKVYFWQLKSSAHSSQKVSLAEARVAVVLDDYKVEYYENYMASLGLLPKKYAVSSRAQAIHMLFKKRVDYILGGELRDAWKVTELGYDVEQIERGQLIPNENKGIYIAMSKLSNADLVEKIKSALQHNAENGQISEIIKFWLQKTEANE